MECWGPARSHKPRNLKPSPWLQTPPLAHELQNDASPPPQALFHPKACKKKNHPHLRRKPQTHGPKPQTLKHTILESPYKEDGLLGRFHNGSIRAGPLAMKPSPMPLRPSSRKAKRRTQDPGGFVLIVRVLMSQYGGLMGVRLIGASV